MLTAAGWLVAAEVSFNHYGDRGRYDLLAHHAALALVLAVEVKTAIGDVQETLGRLDMKVRLARDIARARGWHTATVACPVLVVADERQQHRIVARHSALFARFDLRGRPARAWLVHPSPDVSGVLVYLRLTNARTVSVRCATRGRRVRKRG